jgi:hypothetical protein
MSWCLQICREQTESEGVCGSRIPERLKHIAMAPVSSVTGHCRIELCRPQRSWCRNFGPTQVPRNSSRPGRR